MKMTAVIFRNFLLHSQINYTCEYLGNHSKFSGDSVERFLKESRLRPAFLWERVRENIEYSENGYLILDDTVLAHLDGGKIECVKKQWSGAKHAIVNGIGIINLIYYNPEIDKFWLIDLRVYDPDRDHKTKNTHAKEMLLNADRVKKIKYSSVLFDQYYASQELMLVIGEDLKKYYVTNISSNRLVIDVDKLGGWDTLQLKSKAEIRSLLTQVQDLDLWTDNELENGLEVLLNGFPKKHTCKLYQLARSESRIDNLCTNNPSINNFKDIQKEAALRWKIEQLHREEKQLTGIEKCQCRKQRSQRNFVILASIVHFELQKLSTKLRKTVYQVKKSMLDDYMNKCMIHPIHYIG